MCQLKTLPISAINYVSVGRSSEYFILIDVMKHLYVPRTLNPTIK